MELERRGVPTATFITDAFSAYARGLARMQGMNELPEIVIAHPIASRPTAELRQKVQDAYKEMHAALIHRE